MNERTDLITDRLIIRNVTRADAPAVWEIWKNEENEEYMSDLVASLDEVVAICEEYENCLDFGKGLLRVAVRKSDAAVIGTCCLGNTGKSTEWGFGYSVHPDFWGQGYATEMVRGILDFGARCGIRDFQTSCASENKASARVLQKAGMTFHCKRAFVQSMLHVEYEEDVYTLHLP